jgi:acyl-coenzyme A thioesterase PaaI-like protein
MTPALLARIQREGIQPALAPRNICFGCGAANPDGLGLCSRPAESGDGLVAEWQPAARHQAFEGVLNGGIIGTLLDCHSNWTAIWHFLGVDGGDVPRCCVTADFHVHLRRPTPVARPVTLQASVVEAPAPDRVVVEAQLLAGEALCATCRGLFVSVGPEHPAHHDW